MMERFLTIRKEIALLGFIPNLHDYPHYPFTKRHLGAHLICSLNIASVCIFAIHVADSPKEYMDSLYMITGIVAISVSYATFTFKMTKLFAILSNIEKGIEERK